MTEATTTPETYAPATGRVEIPHTEFLSEDEGGTAETTQETTTTPAQPATPAQPQTPATPAVTTTPATPEKDPRLVETTETGKAAVVQPEQPATTTPKLLADKYTTEAELDTGLQGLGLNPADYQTPEQKEAAYKSGQAAMTRISQAQAERDRIAQQEEAARQQAAIVPATPEQITEKILGSLDMTKINNAEDLVKALVPAIMSNLPQPAAPVDKEQLVEEMQVSFQEREQKTQALNQLEKEVPRLAMIKDEATGQMKAKDPIFRKAFAAFLMSDAKYERGTIGGLQAAMKDFLTISNGGQTMPTAAETAAKTAAIVPDAGGQNPGGMQPASPDDDILGGIIGAHTEHGKRVGNLF